MKELVDRRQGPVGSRHGKDALKENIVGQLGEKAKYKLRADDPFTKMGLNIELSIKLDNFHPIPAHRSFYIMIAVKLNKATTSLFFFLLFFSERNDIRRNLGQFFFPATLKAKPPRPDPGAGRRILDAAGFGSLGIV